jgi:hypothetical protein
LSQMLLQKRRVWLTEIVVLHSVLFLIGSGPARAALISSSVATDTALSGFSLTIGPGLGPDPNHEKCDRPGDGRRTGQALPYHREQVRACSPSGNHTQYRASAGRRGCEHSCDDRDQYNLWLYDDRFGRCIDSRQADRGREAA